MITHLVGWNLVATEPADRIEATAAVRNALESLVGTIPGLLDLVVSSNAVGIAGNSDLALVAHYASDADLRVYIAHPAHQEAAIIVKAHTTDRWAIDLES
jgi:hypothetical protein